jgi:hypothetical protein
VCRSKPHQGIPSTTVTASHVTQGRVEYESMIPRGTDERLDLEEAVARVTGVVLDVGPVPLYIKKMSNLPAVVVRLCK